MISKFCINTNCKEKHYSRGFCINCYKKDFYKKNSKKILEKNKEYLNSNPEKKLLAYTKRRLWAKNNPENEKASRNKYKNSKLGKLSSKINCNKRRSKKLNAQPKWVDNKEIKMIYRNCPEGYEVDHIIPLQGKNVSGLHVSWNLQYLTPEENQKKSNKILP